MGKHYLNVPGGHRSPSHKNNPGIDTGRRDARRASVIAQTSAPDGNRRMPPQRVNQTKKTGDRPVALGKSVICLSQVFYNRII